MTLRGWVVAVLAVGVFVVAGCSSSARLGNEEAEETIRSYAAAEGFALTSLSVVSLKKSEAKQGGFLAEVEASGQCPLSAYEFDDLVRVRLAMGSAENWEVAAPEGLWAFCLPDENTFLSLTSEVARRQGPADRISVVVESYEDYDPEQDYLPFLVEIVRDKVVGRKVGDFRVDGSGHVVGDRTAEVNRVTTLHEARLSVDADGGWSVRLLPPQQTDATTFETSDVEDFSRDIVYE